MQPSLRPLQTADSGPMWAVRDTLAMTWRNLTTMRRLPQVLVFSLVQPVIFVLMFRYVFGGAITIPGRSYVDYLMPGIFVQTVTFGALNTAIGLAEDKGKGLLERLRSLPMSRSAVLGGRVLADTIRNVVIVLLMLAIGVLVGFRMHTNVLMVAAGVGVLVLFGFSLAWLFALLGLSVTNGEAAQAAAFPLLAPLVFASNAFVDPSSMPGWLRWWAIRQPVSKTAEAVRACMLGGPTAAPLIASVLWSLGITAVLAPIAILRYRRS
jgi:ABC-2 type transport system permease protein/oleandomycin transport system permease protein